VAQPAIAAQVVGSAGELIRIHEADPWRVRVTDSGEAALIGRWRQHTDDCAVLGVWCGPRRVTSIASDLVEVAREQGFARLVGPLLREREADAYIRAGLLPVERIVVMRATLPTPQPLAAPTTDVPGIPDGFAVRDATEADLETILAIDAECFDTFWRYDAPSLARFLARERLVVGTVGDSTVGYTLCTLRAGEGSLGRLAVVPSFRRGGIARALVAEALGWLGSRGARHVALSTQEDNTASRTLYRTIGFTEAGNRLLVCASGDLRDRPIGANAVSP
jgi:ribosomal-protein-alanine N-acetyltransferase